MGFTGQRFSREEFAKITYPKCIECAGSQCTSKNWRNTFCTFPFTAEEGPEKDLLNKLNDLYSKDKNLRTSLYWTCYILIFKAGHKAGEVRTCGTTDICDVLEEKAEQLGITVSKCYDCDSFVANDAPPCNERMGVRKRSKKSTTVSKMSKKPNEFAKVKEVTTPAANETSSARTLKTTSSLVYLMWLISLVLD